ncbi:hypothetical protein Ocin01_15072 [Orchesella cincta]|uniref:DUF243 domain-containing protein n=1 Tax=Orchesella cincta TaxID=48709 RepID=A0A1D2MFH2_ORCCI|nr:hypothetical protein Ocin01_15072 [Orchesella cincta]
MSEKLCSDVFRIAVLLFAVCPSHAVMYQYVNPYPHQQLQLHPPAYITAQHYLAVPGRIVHHLADVQPPIRQITPFRRALQLQPPRQQYYEAENENNPDNDGQNPDSSTDPPPPMTTQPPPPPPSDSQTKRIHKHISIHLPPKELDSDEPETTIIRPKLDQPEKHVNIIFVKAPTPESAKKKTEIILPEAPEQKTIVYVLVRKIEKEDLIRVRGPAPTSPPKPQVYYIRYKTKPDDNNDAFRSYSGKYV